MAGTNSENDAGQISAGKPIELPGPLKNEIRQMIGVQVSNRNPIYEKLTSAHLTALIANSDKSQTREHTTNRLVAVAGMILLLAVCWLFLYFGKSEYLDAVISGIAGLLGGYGLGKASKKE